MWWVCTVKLIITINITIDVRRVDDDVRRNETTTKRWALFGPPDEFDVADATLPVSYVLAMRGAKGGALGERAGGVFGTLFMVELGSPGIFPRCNVRACTHNNSSKKYGTPTM